LNAENISTSFPDFIELMEFIGFSIKA